MPSLAVLPGSAGDLDDKKRKRMLSNRDSARRSRMKKQQKLDDLTNLVECLKNQNAQIEMQVNVVTQQYMAVESRNAILRAQMNELFERLQSLNSVLGIIKEVSGNAKGILDISELLFQP